MSVILLILKITGCILLVLLALLLFVLVCVLLIPARYRVHGKFLDERTLCIQVNWLFRVVSYSYVREKDESSGGIRICGIRLKKKEKEDDSESDAPEEDGGREAFGERDEVFLIKNRDTGEQKESSRDGEELAAKEEPSTGKHAEDSGGEKTQERAAEDGAKSGGIAARLQYFFRRLRDTAARFWEAFSKAKGIIADESNKLVLGSVWSELQYLLGHFKIRHIRADVSFSMADPAATGQVLGVLCMMPFLYGQEVNIIPDFEAERMYAEGEVEASGRMRGIHVLLSLVRLIRQREVRSLIKRLRK